MIAALTCLMLLTHGCSTTTTTTTRYRLQIIGNPNAADGLRCFSACKRRALTDRFECLSRCPGVKVREEGKCGDADRPPAATCVTRKKREHHVEAVAGAVVGLLLAAGLIYLAAVNPLCCRGY
jgi:hypothetical protein